MKTQYTPGPWTINTVEADDEGDLCIMVWGDTQAVCAVIVDDDEGWDRDTAEANARLIAASPMLLDALKKIVAWQECFSLADGEADLPIISQARAAIAQAETN